MPFVHINFAILRSNKKTEEHKLHYLLKTYHWLGNFMLFNHWNSPPLATQFSCNQFLKWVLFGIISGNVIVKRSPSKGKGTGKDSDSESDSDDDSDDDSDSSSDSSSDDDDDKPELSEKCTQTAGPSYYEDSSDEEIKVEMKDQSTETDEIPKEEKGVNTRSRSLQSLSSHRRSPPKDGSDTDNSLAARRRRRRERAQTTQVNYNHSLDGGDGGGNFDNVSEEAGMTYPGRKPRSRFLPSHSTFDNGDMYYDADSHNTSHRSSTRDLPSSSNYMWQPAGGNQYGSYLRYGQSWKYKSTM